MNTALIRVSPFAVLARYNGFPPRNKIVDGDTSYEGVDRLGNLAAGLRLVEWRHVDEKPGFFYRKGEEIVDFTADVLTTTIPYTAWTQAEIDAYRAAQRDTIAGEMDELESVTRAAVLVIMDELNRHSDKITELGQAIAGASSLADVKSRVSAIQPIPQRSGADLKAAIRQKLGAA